MNFMRRIKTLIFLSLVYIISLLVSLPLLLYADEGRQNLPPYNPGRFIIKFKSEGEFALNGCAHCLLANAQKFKNALADGGNSVDALNSRYGITGAEGLFFEQHHLTASQARNKRGQQIQKVKAKFAARSRRAPPGLDPPDVSNIYVFEVPPKSDIEEICLQYNSDPHIEFAHPDYIMTNSATFNDPFWATAGTWGQVYDDLWGLKIIQLEAALDPPSTQGEGIVIGVIDSGVDWRHIDMADNIWVNPDEVPGTGFDNDNNQFVDDIRGWDFVNNDNDPMDGHGHGTHVAGSIAAVANNGFGIVGVAPKAKIMPVKGLSDGGGGSMIDLARAMDYATMNGADILHNSWGCGNSRCPSVPAAELSVQQAYFFGAVVIFSAGNLNDDVQFYSPKNMEETIVVAASDPEDLRESFSNYGALLDVTAPGRDILSLNARGGNNTIATQICPACVVNTDYLRLSGTSMSAAYASGLAALILSSNPGLINEDVRQVMRAATDDIESTDFDILTGAGRINTANAMNVGSILDAHITEPNSATLTFTQDGALVIKGSAAGANFEQYRLFYSPKETPSPWNPIGVPGVSEISNGVLGYWDVTNLPLGEYYLYLKADSTEGWDFEDVISFYLLRSPVLEPVAEQTVPENEALRFSVVGTHQDGNALTLEAIDPLPVNATFDAGPSQVLADGTSRIEGVFDWTPDGTQSGEYTVFFRLADNNGSQVNGDPVRITVTDVANSIPTVQWIKFTDNVLMWSARDREDDSNLNFSYRIDEGPWSLPSPGTLLTVDNLGLSPGWHVFEVKAIDQLNEESRVKFKKFKL